MNYFEWIRTDDALEVSQRTLHLERRTLVDALVKVVEPHFGEELCNYFKLLLDDKISDTPVVRHWLTSTRGLLAARHAERDPAPTTVSHFELDDMRASRLYEVHAVRALEIEAMHRVRANEPFDWTVKIPPPRRMSVGPWCEALFGDVGTVHGWRFVFLGGVVTVEVGRVRVSFDLTTDQVEVVGPSIVRRAVRVQTVAGMCELPVHDTALCEPYRATAAIVRGEEAVRKWTDVLAEAVLVLARINAELAVACLKLAPVILPLHSGAISFGSASTEDVLGVVYLPGVMQVPDIAECLVHEALHQKLFRVETSVLLFTPDSPREEVYLSPWRNDPRPLRMMLHGAYVFTAVAELWHHWASSEDTRWTPEDAERLALLRVLQSLDALDTVERHGHLSEFGGRVVRFIRQHAEVLRSELQVTPMVADEVRGQIEFHAARYPHHVR